MSKLITVCIPTYNRDYFLGRCLRSILSQTFPKNLYEIIVVDDGSNDKTDLILNSFSKDVIILKNKKKLGLSKSLNKAIFKSSGKYFLRLDSDDYVNENYINFLYSTLNFNRKEFDGVKCDYYLIDEKENVIRRCNAEKEPIACGILFKIKDLFDVGMYNEKLKIDEEIDLIKRLNNKKKFKIFRLPVPLYRYRMHKNNLSKKNGSKKK